MGRKRIPRFPDIDDDGKLNDKYRAKKSGAKKRGLPCKLTYAEYVQLLRDAGIKSSDVGTIGYHLARYGDVGGYEVGNCRFVPYKVNSDERTIDGAKALLVQKLNCFVCFFKQSQQAF